jgi:hypothetical protein
MTVVRDYDKSLKAKHQRWIVRSIFLYGSATLFVIWLVLRLIAQNS